MAIPKSITLYQKNDQNILITGLQDINAVFLNTATVTATLVDSTGAVVKNQDGTNAISALVLIYVAASSGNYQGTVEQTFNPSLGAYTLLIDAVQSGTDLHLEIPAVVAIRRS